MINKNSGNTRRSLASNTICACLEHDFVSRTTRTRHCIHEFHLTHTNLDQEDSVGSQPDQDREYKPSGDGVTGCSTHDSKG